MKESTYIWKNGEFLPWKEATTHVLTHCLHYGTGVFEGIRAYKTPNGPAIFKGKEHYDRLLNSGKILLMTPPYDSTTLLKATKELIHKNKLNSCYIRPLFYYGYGEMGLNPKNIPIDTIIATWEWGSYLGEEGLKNGIRCKISSWNRLDSRIAPPLSKTTANYINSALAKQEAINCGFEEAILLNINGHVAEGPGENLFLIKENTLFTPPLCDNVLDGITRKSVITLAKDLGYNVIEKSLIRDELFIADELFFTGTAAEVTPIREIDSRIIGSGKRGPITEKIQSLYFKTVEGKNKKRDNWLDYIK